MRGYEGIFIVKPEAEKEELNRLSGLVQETITKNGGQITKVDLWGRRLLGHRIKKNMEGQYIYACFDLEPSKAGKLQQSIRLQEEILKAMITQKGPDPASPAGPSPVSATEKGGKDGRPE